MKVNNILKSYTLEEIYMIRLCTNVDKNSIIKELENLKCHLGKDLKNIVENCIDKVKKAEDDELQKIIDYPLE